MPTEEHDRSEDLIRGIPLFAPLPRVAVRRLVEHAQAARFAKQAVICRQGDAGDSLFIVKRGQVEILLTEDGGRETRLAVLRAGEFFGELAVLDGEPRSATARCSEESELLVLNREQLFAILREPNVLENFLTVLTGRVRAANQIVATRGVDNRKLEEQALTDALTGLGNRRKLWRDLKELEARCQRYGYVFALGMCDVDRFKRYNDTYGHAQGDQLLQSLGRTLRQRCRTGDEVYRYGGEEFVVIMPGQTEDSAWTGLERLRASVEGLRIPHSGNAPEHVVTFSGGVAAMTPEEDGGVSAALTGADKALYQAKSRGRNRIMKASLSERED